ncbi:hypothetical protein BDZ89DRAFT_1065323, partial [Hymenopellis radicata]
NGYKPPGTPRGQAYRHKKTSSDREDLPASGQGLLCWHRTAIVYRKALRMMGAVRNYLVD